MAGEVVFMPSEADFVAAQRDYWRASMRRGRGLRLFLIFPAVFALLGAFDGDGSLAWNVLGYGLGGAIIGGIAVITIFALAGGETTYRQQRNLHKEFQYGWSEEGLSYRTKYGSGIMPWHELHRWSDGRHTFLLYINDRLFHFLPKRVLTEEQAADVRATVTQFGPPHR